MSNSSVVTPLLGITSGSNINLTGQANYHKSGSIQIISSSLYISSLLSTPLTGSIVNIFNSNVEVSQSVLNMVENPIDINVLSISGSMINEHLLDITSLTGSYDGELVPYFEDNITYHFTCSNSNEVAYLRFASVYKEFSDVTDFEKEAAEFVDEDTPL